MTTHQYHAKEIAAGLDVNEYDAIVCCSGDGIPHEVINGFAERPDGRRALSSMPLCQLPGGSGNSMAVSLNGNGNAELAALNIVKGIPMKVDLMVISQKSAPPSLSFLTQAYGIIADADLGTENLRWMGPARFTAGVMSRLLSRTSYPCEIAVKYSHETKRQVFNHFNRSQDATEGSTSSTRPAINIAEPVQSRSSEDTGGSTTESTRLLEGAASFQQSDNTVEGGVGPLTLKSPESLLRFGTIDSPVPSDWTVLDRPNLAVFYAGKMPWVSADVLMFPASLACDGTMDMILIDSTIGRFKSIDLLIKTETGKHFHLDHTEYSKIEAYRLTPKIPKGYLSIDGESFPFEPLQVEILPAAGCLLSATGSYAYTGFGDSHPTS